MEHSTQDRFARLLEGSAANIARSWDENRPNLLKQYSDRLEEYIRNRENPASSAIADHKLFVPFEGHKTDWIVASKECVIQKVRCNVINPEQLGEELGRSARSLASFSNPIVDVYGCIASTFGLRIKGHIHSVASECDVDIVKKDSLVSAHWVMIRGAFRRWCSAQSLAIPRGWGEARVAELLLLETSQVHWTKTMRLVFGWDLKTVQEKSAHIRSLS